MQQKTCLDKPVRAHPLALAALLSLSLSVPVLARPAVSAPQQEFGHRIGDDYFLINYQQLQRYWRKLDRESERLQVVEIGKTAEGRSQLMAIVTAPENFKKLDRYRQISRRLALAEGLTDAEAKALAAEGKAVVWIDGGLHATEVLGAHQLVELVYQMVSQDDPETQRILDNVILLAVHANPDGQDLVSDWYMRKSDPSKRSFADIPRLYQKYIGHDNNRDFYLNSQPESENMSRVLYREWFPQILYNHHQTGPAGTVMFAPPFRDPFNYQFDPLIPMSLNLVGGAMHTRFAAEGKPGTVMAEGAGFSTWFNGGLRTTAYFHNMVGLLTETIGSPTPMEVPFVPARQLPNKTLPFPIAPQKWHFRQSIDYSLTANRAVLDLAARYREMFLFNIYQMGRNAIARGSTDTWTTLPRRLEAVKEAIRKEQPPREPEEAGGIGVDYFTTGVPLKYWQMLRRPEWRDPRGYVIPADQRDFLTATKFVAALVKSGISVQRATAPFRAGGRFYPAGSYVVSAAQAFRPHVLDMFEPQDHPDDIPYPGGPPTPPYDNAGYTLALQMGVQFDRVFENLKGPFVALADPPGPPPGKLTGAAQAAGFLLDHRLNDAFIAVNRLLADGRTVFWLKEAFAEAPAGTFYIPNTPGTLERLAGIARGVGLDFAGVAQAPAVAALKLQPLRIGLVDRYGGLMTSGWLRWLFEQYGFNYQQVFAQQLDAGNLRARYDVLVFPDGSVPRSDSEALPRYERIPQPQPEEIPVEYRGSLGKVTVAKTMPRIREFIEAGGTAIAIGSGTHLGTHLGLPIKSALLERAADGSEKPLPRSKYYIPGSILQAAVDPRLPVAHGLPTEVDLFFNNSPVFTLLPTLRPTGIEPIVRFESEAPLRSGWAWGQNNLKGAIAALEAPLGKGRVYLFGPEIVNRAQAHGTFKFLFNSIYLGGAEPASSM